MAKRRYIKDSFRSDGWIEDLDPLERYLYLYLLTNEYVNCCGIYEIKTKRIAFETGLDNEMVKKMIWRFQEAEKVFYNDWIILIVNFVKNQSVTSETDNLRKWIVREVKELWQSKINKIIGFEGSCKVVARCLQGAYKDVGIPYLTLLYLTLPNPTLPNVKKKDPSKKSEEKTYPPDINEYSQDLELLIGKWNSVHSIGDKEWLMKCQWVTTSLEQAYTKIRKKHAKEHIWTAINNYMQDIKNRDKKDSYSSHRFSLYRFLKQENGFTNFYNI